MPGDMVDAVLAQQSAPQDSQTPGQDAVDSILQAASQSPQQLDPDPAYQSMQLHTAVMQAHGQQVPDDQKRNILDAYRSIYGQRPMAMAGGNSIMQNTLQAQAAGNTAVGNFTRAGVNAMAQTGANVAGIVAPDFANQIAQKAQEEYNPDMTSVSGKAGGITGSVVASLPAVLTPGAAVPVFAAEGFGSANREVSQRNANGQNIGLGQRFAYAGSEAAIQALVAHFLGNMGTGGFTKTAQGELTQAVPLQGLLRRLSPDLLNAVQGTDGAVLRPAIQRTLLNMGVGAGQNEIAMIASEIAKSATGVTGSQDQDLVDRVLSQTPETLVSGAAQAAPFAIHGEVKARDVSSGPVERATQEDIQQMGKAGETPRVVRYAAETNPFPDEQPAQNPPTTPAEGRQLPAEQPLAEDKDFMDLTDTLHRQARESDELLSQPDTGPLKGNGTLPNDAYDTAKGEEHPLVSMLKTYDASIRQVDVPDHLSDDFDVLKEHGITPVAVTGDKTPAGFSSPEVPNSVAVDVSNPRKSFWNVLAHEAGHIFQYNNPEAAKTLYDQIPESFRRQARDRYFQLMKKQRGAEAAQEYLAKYGKEEVVSMAMGEAAASDSMVQRAFKKDTGLWGQIQDAFTRTLNKFSGRGRMLNAIADEMRQGLGLREASEKPAGTFDVGQAKRIAAAYDAMKHEPNNPKVKASYDAFKTETMQQFKDAQAQGLKMEPWTGEGQPYKNSKEMTADVKDNKHLWFFTGGEMPADHPLAEKTGVKVNGQELTYNDAFRAIHDFYGHANTGAGFGPKGEEAAWEAHSKMFSKEAQPAMTSETRGQNSWVNFGPHGEANRANPAATVYAEQKAGILPEEFHPSEGRQAPRQRQYTEIGHQAEGKADVDLWWEDKDGDVKTAPATGATATHYHANAELAEVRGRIDHTNKEISLTKSSGDEAASKHALYVGKQLQKKHPDYDVYVAGRGGMEPLEEATSHGRFMLDKLDNIANDEEDVKKYKAALNAASPANAIKFETTMEDKLKRATLDSQAPLVNMLRTAMSRVNDPAKLSPEAYLRRMFGFRERRYQQEKVGLRSLQGEELVDKKTGENLTRDWLVQPLIDYAKKSGEKAEDVKAHAQSVMVAQRTLEKAAYRKAKGESMDEPISGIGEKRVSPGSPGERDVEEATEFLGHAAQDNASATATEYARRLRQWGNEHMKMAVDSGLVSVKDAKKMLDENEFYVNMQRVMEDRGLLGDSDFADGKYHRFRGSNRLIDDPLANTLQTTEQIAKKAEQNFTKQRIVDLVRPFGDMIQKAKAAASDTITVKENGQDVHYHVDPQVASVVNGWGSYTPPALWGALSLPGRLKAFGTLLRPMFRWNHFRKQFQNRLLISQEAGGFKGIADTIKGFDPDAKELLDVLGGTMSHERDYGSSSSDYYNLIRKMTDKIGKDGTSLLALPKKLWNGYQKLGEWSDAFNRVVEFKGAYAAAKRRGMNELDAQNYAAWKARDLMDFSVAGEAVKQINRIAYQPFLNAEIQGLRKIYELAREKPALAASRLAMFGLVPAMIPYLWAKSQGKETEARYKDTPLAQRIGFYQFHVGNYRVMVPKGQTQAMVSAMWEAFLDKHNGNVSTWAKAMGDSGLVPRPLMDPESLLPFQGVREAISNYSWFYDRHIIPPDQEGLALDLRHTDGSSGLAQRIGEVAKKAGWELDPRKIDHVLANDFGTIGIDAETASNIGGQKKPLATTALASYGDVRLPPGYTSVSVQDAMSAAQRYNDTSSPQYKQVQEALGESYKATTVEERNRLVDQARAAADAANDFYRKHGDELLAVKKATQQIDEAFSEGAQQKAAGKAPAWAAANQAKVVLIRDRTRLETLQKRISELRKALVNPRLSDSTKAMADRDISRLYSIIVKMVGDAEKS